MSRSFRSYRDLEVWKQGVALAKCIYQATAPFPGEEKCGLVNQMRRAAVSIPSNIAEGHARSKTGEFKYAVSVAMGSVAELETQIILSAELGYLKDDLTNQFLSQLGTIGRMLRGLQKSLSKRT